MEINLYRKKVQTSSGFRFSFINFLKPCSAPFGPMWPARAAAYTICLFFPCGLWKQLDINKEWNEVSYVVFQAIFNRFSMRSFVYKFFLLLFSFFFLFFNSSVCRDLCTIPTKKETSTMKQPICEWDLLDCQVESRRRLYLPCRPERIELWLFRRFA